MHISELDDDFSHRVSFEKNGMLSRAIPFSPLLLIDSLSRKSFLYNKLPPVPLKLTVLKLDGSSFDIEVVKTATVAELKQAVETAFRHLPKEGPGKVSWSHLWGHFCLCYDGQKLLTDSDYIGSYGIKDGDQLHFIRHVFTNYNMIKTRSEKQVPALEQPRMSSCGSCGCEDRLHNGEADDICDDQEILSHRRNDDNDVISQSEYRLAHLLSGWFAYRRLTSQERRFEEKSCSNSSRFANGFLGSFRNIVRFCSKKYNS